MDTVFSLPAWALSATSVALIIPNKQKYPFGVPVQDCLMFQPTSQECWTFVTVGTLDRTFTNILNNIGIEGSIKFTFASARQHTAPLTGPSHPSASGRISGREHTLQATAKRRVKRSHQSTVFNKRVHRERQILDSWMQSCGRAGVAA